MDTLQNTRPKPKSALYSHYIRCFKNESAMDITKDIRPLTEFKRDTGRFVSRNGTPLDPNGKRQAVAGRHGRSSLARYPRPD